MKRLLLALTAFVFSLFIQAQVLYEVTFQAPLDSQMVYLLNAENKQVIDSAIVSNDTCFFRGVMSESIVAVLNTQPTVKNYLTALILDSEPLKITYEKGGRVSAKGSTVNQRYADYSNVVNDASRGLVELQKEYMVLLKEHKNIIPDSMMIRLEDMYDHIAENIVKANKIMVEKNRDNLIPLLCLCNNTQEMGYEYVENYLATYKYQDRECLKSVKDEIERERCKRPGQPFVDLTLINTDGEEVKLSKYIGKGKYVLVDFWASWCGPCRKELPEVRTLYNKYHKKGLEIVGISLDNKLEAWKKAIKDMVLKWPQLSDLKGWESQAAEVYNIQSIPATILYGPDGNVIQANLRGQRLKDRLKEIFSE